MADKIVISGMGVVTPIGDSVESFWDASLEGKSGLRMEERMDLSALPCGWVAAVVPEETKKTIKARWGESNHAWGDILMHVAVSQALEDAAFDGGLTRPAGLVWARVWPGPSGSFPQDYVDYMKNVGERYTAVGSEPGDVVAYLRAKQENTPMEATDLSAFSTELSAKLGVPLIAARLDATCAGGLRALIEATRLLKMGKVDFAVVAAVVSRSNHYTLSQYAQLMALSRWKNPPAQACMPFDKRRSGMVISELSGAIVLEKGRACPRARRQRSSRGDRRLGVGCRYRSSDRPQHRDGGACDADGPGTLQFNAGRNRHDQCARHLDAAE